MLLRRALEYATPLTATLVSVNITMLFVWAFAATTARLEGITFLRVLPFLVGGLAAPGLARLALFHGVDRIGVARASILMGSTPLFAIGLAVLFLAERPSPLLIVGAVLVVGGGALLTRRGVAEKAWRPRDLLLPIVAALGFAFRDNVSRWGLRDLPEPLVAAASATLASVVVMWLFALTRRGTGRVRFRTAGLRFLALAGIFEGIAYLAMWQALTSGHVSVVSPLVNSSPFFSVLLAAIFLRDLERITWRFAVAAVLVVVGVALVVGGRPA